MLRQSSSGFKIPPFLSVADQNLHEVLIYTLRATCFLYLITLMIFDSNYFSHFRKYIKSTCDCGDIFHAVFLVAVIPTWKEPMPGWVDSLNGPIGIMVGGGKGVIRSMYCKGDHLAQVIPVDAAINGLIAVAWWTGTSTKRYEAEQCAMLLHSLDLTDKPWRLLPATNLQICMVRVGR